MSVSEKTELKILSIRSFGGLALSLGDGGQPLRFETRTLEALLVYLACQGRALGRDTLAELLWPERSQEQARTNLSLAIHRLRRQLDPYLLVTRHTLGLNEAAGFEVDVTHFERHLAAGRLAEATALYRGDFLDGFFLRNNPAFEQWALLERDRLRTLALAAWQQLIAHMATAGELDSAIAGAQRLLQLDPLHEPTHRQLMRLLAQAGQRSAALAQYESCRQLLASELDVAPDEMTTTLSEQIRLGQIELPATANTQATLSVNSVSPRPAIGPSPHNLPRQPTPFIGRSAEMAQIEHLLANPDCRLLTLLGAGGIGKSRLALETASQRSDGLDDGVCFVALASVVQAEFVPVAIAQSLGIQTAGSDLQERIAAYLRPRALLLILDNFEQLLEAADIVGFLLQQAPLIKVLVTSRERLHLREEWLLPISGLSVAEGLAGEAGQLFLRTAQRLQLGFTGIGQEEAIGEICRLVEGMPLALELAATWVRVMSCTEIARQVQSNFDFLSTDLRNLPERHRSMRALFDQSWRLLSALEQGVLMRLSVFAGGWTLEEARPVSGATHSLLLGLVDKSLVRVNGQNRFDLHELVRQFAAEKLVAAGEAEVARERHFAAYLHLIRSGDTHLRRVGVTTWLARLQADLDNLRAALQWSLDEAHYADAAWLMVALHYFWYLGGHRYEGGRWLARLLPHRQALPNELRLATLICFLASAQEFDELQSLDLYKGELVQLSEDSSHKALQAVAWNFVAWSTSDLSQALAASQQAVPLARAANAAPTLGPEFSAMADSNFALASVLQTYAEYLLEQGEVASAAANARESLTLFRRQGDLYGIADSLGTHGRLALLQGNIEQAHTLLKEVMNQATPLTSGLVQARWQPLLGIVSLYRGDVTEARRLLEESLNHCLDFKNKLFLARVYAYLAETALWEGELEQAEQWLAQSLAYHPDSQSITMYQVQRLVVAARLATAREQYLRAAMLFGLAEKFRKQLGYELAGPVRAQVDRAWATVRLALGAEVAEKAFAAGEQLSLDEAFATLLAS